MDRNKLAILTNQLGGYDETEKAIGVDAELIERAVSGEHLTHKETAQIDRGFSELYEYPTEIDLETLFGTSDYDKGLTGDLDDTERFFYDVDFSNNFRQMVAETDFDIGLLNRGGSMFANFTPKMMSDVNALIASNEGNVGQEIAEMFEAYISDGENGIPFWRQDQLAHDSEFWEWFRETFYGDD